ncbi:unnamed protein product, partial [Mesorhabditis belari]|uniref:Transmembrane protein n=1 Tax=Mesorhabditis belari TaxID=2138241 RepID=A0AAF3J4Q5_9BILA
METTVQQAVPQDEPRLEAADVDNPLDQQEDNELDEVGDAFPKKPKKHPIVVVIIMIFAFLSQLSVVVYCAHLGKQHEHVFSWDREHSVTYISITEYLDAIVFSLMFTVSPLLCFFGTCVTPVYIVAPYLFAPLYVEKLQRTICVLFRATTYMILPALNSLRFVTPWPSSSRISSLISPFGRCSNRRFAYCSSE